MSLPSFMCSLNYYPCIVIKREIAAMGVLEPTSFEYILHCTTIKLSWYDQLDYVLNDVFFSGMWEYGANSSGSYCVYGVTVHATRGDNCHFICSVLPCKNNVIVICKTSLPTRVKACWIMLCVRLLNIWLPHFLVHNGIVGSMTTWFFSHLRIRIMVPFMLFTSQSI